MSPRILCLLHILAALLLAPQALGQPDPDTRWECAVGGGFLIPHRSVIRSHITGHAGSVQLTWSRRGGGLWSCSRPQPRWGFSTRINSTGAPEAIGLQVHGLGMAELNITGRLRFRMAGGLGWSQRHWSEEDAAGRERVVIGSPLNSAIEIGLHKPALPGSDLWLDRIGAHLCLSHQSNASVTQPNLGTNVLTFALSTSVSRKWRPKPPAQDTLMALSILPGPVQGWMVHGTLGRRQPAPLAQRETVGELGIDWRRGSLRKGYVLGAMAWTRPDVMAAGVHAGFQIRFTRVQIDLLHGRYLVRLQQEEAAYNRVVFQWHGRGALWWRIGLHTHGFRAHHPVFGMGWSLSGKTPYALR